MARALFVGSTSALTAGALAGWLAAGNSVAAFWTEARVRRSPLDRWLVDRWSVPGLIARHGLAARQVPRLSKWSDLDTALDAVEADVLITAATSMIVPDRMLARFGSRAVNVHPALLPAYRGPAPYLPILLDQRGDSDAGVTLHVLSPEIDEGDIIAATPIRYSDAVGRFSTWYGRHVGAAFRLVRDELPRYLDGTASARPQPAGGSYVRVSIPVLLDAELPAARIAQMLERAGASGRIAVQLPGRRRPVVVTDVVGSMAPTGAAPTLTLTTVEMDFADARLRLRRSTRLDRWRDARQVRAAIEAQL